MTARESRSLSAKEVALGGREECERKRERDNKYGLKHNTLLLLQDIWPQLHPFYNQVSAKIFIHSVIQYNHRYYRLR